MRLFAIIQCITAAIIATTQVNAIYFGTATDRPSSFGNIVPSSFNLLVAENAMKWGSMQSSASSVNYSTSQSLISYAKSNRMKMRGHALVWHAQMPSFICGNGCPSTSYSGSQLEQLIDARIKGVFANLDHSDIICWDVVNEAIADGGGPMRNSAFVQKMGTNFVETVFRIARKYAPPNVKLFYNDYNCEVYGNQKTTNCFNLVKGLASKGLIDGMGFQMHLSLQYGENSQMGGFAQTMKQYTDLGLEVHVTEMDVGIANTSGTEAQRFQTQANWYANIGRICKANPKCTAFVVWGVTDNTSWRADGKPLLFTSNSQKKPAYDAVVAALGGVSPPSTSGPSPTTRPPTSGPSPTTRPPTNAPSPSTGGADRWGQCGGLNFTGPKTCKEGTCKYVNDWYSQCQ